MKANTTPSRREKRRNGRMRLGKADIREIGGLAVEVGSLRDPYQGILNSNRGKIMRFAGPLDPCFARGRYLVQ